MDAELDVVIDAVKAQLHDSLPMRNNKSAAGCYNPTN